MQALAESLSLPIYLNGSARGALPPGHPLLFVRSRREGKMVMYALTGAGEALLRSVLSDTVEAHV